MITPIITICGRPNVGKSTLFNRILGKRKSIVSEIPGTTRDALQSNCIWKEKSFTFQKILQKVSRESSGKLSWTVSRTCAQEND